MSKRPRNHSIATKRAPKRARKAETVTETSASVINENWPFPEGSALCFSLRIRITYYIYDFDSNCEVCLRIVRGTAITLTVTKASLSRCLVLVLVLVLVFVFVLVLVLILVLVLVLDL